MKDDIYTYTGIENEECERCKLKISMKDQFKCLIFGLGLSLSLSL